METVGLRKVYNGKAAVDNLSLEVHQGEVFGFLGPNGAGKTTAIKMLMGLVRPTAGTARLLGRPVGDMAVRRQIGFLPEQFRFHDWLQATEFLNWHGELYGMPAAQRDQRIPEVLRLVGLGDVPRQRLHTFSKGMLQRIGIAQALLNKPTLVFLDEPTSALDPLGRRDVRDVIRQLRAAGVTVFLNSHLLSEIELVCDRVAIIAHGRVVRQGAMQELLKGELEVELRAEGLDEAALAELRRLSLSLRVERDRLVAAIADEATVPLLAAAVVRAGGRLHELTPRRHSLEELFVSAVEEEQS
ncbi:MAG: ABC transporter ATP-binding protein [Chloroflexota bacterium]